MPDALGYFSIACMWFGMGGYMLWEIRFSQEKRLSYKTIIFSLGILLVTLLTMAKLYGLT